MLATGGSSVGVRAAASIGGTPVIGTYTPTPPLSPDVDLPPGSGPIMPSMTVHYVWWLPTGDHFESDSTGDSNYENLLIRFANDLGSNQYHNLLTQYNGTNGTIGNTVSYGGSWTDTAAYPHAGTIADPLQDSDIQAEVTKAVAANGWSEGLNDIVAVFTANGIQECNGGNCTFSTSNGFCAYHNHYTDGSNDSMYAFMAFDNFTHVPSMPNLNCLAGAPYPNGDVSADSEINTLSHELAESETDPHPNATWTAPNPEGEIGDACNFNFAPRNDIGADVYLNGDPYVVQMLYSNAAHNCAIDLPTNGFCAGSVSNVCSPTTSFTKAVDNAAPNVESTINYTLTLNNSNDTAAETNLTLSDAMPSGYVVTNVSAPNSTTSTFGPSSVTVTYDTLPVHQQRAVTITATVPVQAGTTATNCASLTGFDLLTTTAIGPQTTSPCASTTPVKIPTTITYTGPTSGDFNDPVTVSATLTDSSSNPVAGKSLNFTLNGVETCTKVTDAFGSASCQITPGEASGPYTLTAAFTDSSDPVYAVSSHDTTFTVLKEESKVTYTGPPAIHYHDPVTVSAMLTDPDGGAPIAGKTVTFTLGATDSCHDTTNASGVATCQLTPTVTGPQSIVASFAGDTFYLASSDPEPFSVTPEETTINYTGPKVILAGAGGATLTAKLVEDGANDNDSDSGSPGPVPAEPVTLSIGSQQCTGTTMPSGNVTCTIPSVSVPLGPETVSAAFAGDAYYQPATDSTTAIVFAFPSRGAFTLGDTTAATAGSGTVTWWADTWPLQNTLSGGTAPNSFKGFAATITLPTTSPPAACGSHWTTGTGDSPPPTSGVPSYMGVVVTSTVNKSGSTIAGNSVHIIVIKVAPGYSPNPGSHGTGTIVATFC
jgi:uncharacterized repeat protein (TIGR01451 family)